MNRPSSFVVRRSSFVLRPLSSVFRRSLFVLLALCAFALMPLTAPGYFSYAHDARHSVYFLRMFDEALRDGAWYPRWAADMTFGYGYPLWLILAPIPFFVGEAFHLIGFDFVSAVKIVDGLAVFCSALTMYLFAARVLGKRAGIVAAVAYVYVPYHLVDVYVRAAQAELVAFVFPPLVFWAFHTLLTTHHARDIPLAALAYAGLILSHISIAVIFTPIIGLYLVFLLVTSRPATDDRRPSHSSKFQVSGFTFHVSRFRFSLSSFLFPLSSLVLALALSAIFWLPVLFEQRYLTSDPLIGGFFNYRKHFVNAQQLFSPFWGYGYAGEYGTDQFSLQLGLAPVLLAFVAILGCARMRAPIRAHVVLFASIVVAMVFAMLPISAPLWEPFASVIAFVQFPWRLLIVTAFALAFLMGAAVHTFAAPSRVTMWTLVVLIIAMSYPYTQPQHTEAVFTLQTQMEFELKDGELLGDTVWMTGERPKDSPLVEQYLSGEPLRKAIALDAHAHVETIRTGGHSTVLRVDTSAPTRVLVYTRYFPGWTAYRDGQRLEIEPYGEQGLILVHVPTGSHVVTLRFEDTPIRQIGAVISLLALVITLGGLVRLR